MLFRDTDGALRAQIVLSLHHDGARPLIRITGIEARYRLSGSSGPWRLASAEADAREIGLLEVGVARTKASTGGWRWASVHVIAFREPFPAARFVPSLLMEAGKAYVARFRLADGQRLVRDLVTAPEGNRTVAERACSSPAPPKA